MKESILKKYNIGKIIKTPADIVVDVKVKKGIEPNTIVYNEIKTDGIVITRYNDDTVYSKVIGASVTIVDNYVDTVSSGICLESRLTRRLVYSEKWVTEKDIKRISKRCHNYDINRFMTDEEEIEIDDKSYILTCNHKYDEFYMIDKIGNKNFLKSDGQIYQIYEANKYYVRNASYVIRGVVRGTVPNFGNSYIAIYVDFDKATAATVKGIKDDIYMMTYELNHCN